MRSTKKIVIVGATSSIAEHCARHWVQAEPVDLSLLGRDLGRLDRIAADLGVRSPASTIQTQQADFLDPATIQATVDAIVALGRVDIVLIAQGSLPDQPACQDDLSACNDALQINAISPVLYAEAFAKHLATADHGTLVVIGSVAGDRGRRSNYVYGAAKGLVARYLQGLQHRFANTGVQVVLIKPGPTDTPMTAHLKRQGARLAPVQAVAEQIVAAAAGGTSTRYTPRRWRLIMLVITHLPAFVFKRLNI